MELTFDGRWVSWEGSESLQVLCVMTRGKTRNQHSLEGYNESTWRNLVIKPKTASEINFGNSILNSIIT